MWLWHYPMCKLLKPNTKTLHAPLIYVELVRGNFVVGSYAVAREPNKTQSENTDVILVTMTQKSV